MQLKSLILAAALLPLINAAPVAAAKPNRNPTVLNEKAADYSIVKEREAEEEKREDLYIGTNYYDKRGVEERGRICVLSRTIMIKSSGLAANG
ncbi:hypothetical protein BGZ57DRAFT_932868 [Hyaloscypha finlandica]|nr:hypothetical protein BGZ57DRAFT_932868 [Hyaloscypha finlandica]